MNLFQKLSVATAGLTLSFVAIGAKPSQAASLNLSAALTATGVDTARSLFGVDGTGIKIGIISDSFNTSTSFDQFGNQDTYATDIANGYLPSGIQVFNDFLAPGNNDEARALAEVVHAIAPGASIAVYVLPDVTSSPADQTPRILAEFSDAIQTLAAAGANIIVDDYGDPVAEPQPPKGALNQAIQAVFKQGVSYFSSAGNDNPIYPISGHANSPDAVGVGAVYYGNDKISPFSPFFGFDLTQGQLEPYSSQGDPNLPYEKPDVVAPDGLDISFNLGGSPFAPKDQTTGFYTFFGTSAAAPFSAAIAALISQAVPNATPSDIYSALRDTAKPLDASQPGFNYSSGYGLIQADKAIEELKAKSVPEPVDSAMEALAVLSLGGLLLKKKVFSKQQSLK